MYIYRKTIFKETNDIIGIDISQNSADKTDFETTYKSQVAMVSDMYIAETSFLIDKSWSNFKALIDGTIRVWGDVKCMESEGRYILNLVTTNPI